MALFIRITKTAQWYAKGDISFKKFTDAEQNKALTISLHADDGRKHSITLYKGELEQLEYILCESGTPEPTDP